MKIIKIRPLWLLLLCFMVQTGSAQESSIIIDETGGGLGDMWGPAAVAVDASGNVYVAGSHTNNLFKIAPDGTVTQLLDSNGDGSNSYFKSVGVAVDSSGNVYSSARETNNVFKITPDGSVSEIIDGNAGGAGTLSDPRGIAVDSNGNVFVTGHESDNVFKITPDGTITEVINATAGGTGTLDNPRQVAVDSSGNAYVTGSNSSNAFKIAVDGSITEIISASAGGAGTLSIAEGIVVDADGNVYVTGAGSTNAFKISTDGSIIEIINASDGGSNPLDNVRNVVLGTTGNVYVSSQGSDSVFQVAADGNVTELGAAQSGLIGPRGMAVDSQGNLYVAGANSHNVIKFSLAVDINADLAAKLPLLAGTSTSGGATSAVLQGGVSADSGSSFTNGAFSVGEQIEIKGLIKPDDSHLGQDAGLVVAVIDLADPEHTLLFTNAGLVAYDGSTVLFFDEVTLSASHQVDITAGSAIPISANLAGSSFNIYIGYLINDSGEVIYTTEPISLEISQ